MRTLRTLLVGAGLLASPALSRADEVDNLTQRIVELEAQVRELDIQLKPQGDTAEAVQRRLIDAQVLYELKSYESAATILLDLVEKHANAPEYPEAVYLLADSLYLKRDVLPARRYFEKAVEVGPSSKHYQPALERLIELSLYTSDYGPVDSYLEKLGQLVGTTLNSSVPYVKGKYFYFRHRYGDATAVLSSVVRTSPYWLQAQYFIGACKVAQNKPGEAVQVFDALVKAEPKTDVEKRIVELGHLALGRVYYDQNQLSSATIEYSKIPQTSDLFTDALYEGAWVSIKDKFYQKAYRALDLLLTIAPEGPQVPDVRLLMGRLQIQQNDWDGATSTFTKTRDQFEVIRKEVSDTIKSHGDGKTFFKQLLAKNLTKFDLSTYFPASAIKWVQKDPDLDRLTSVLSDVSDLQTSINESDELVVRLEKAFNGPSRVNIFPELAIARTKAAATGTRLIDIDNALLEQELKYVAPGLGDRKAEIDRVLKTRKQLEKQLADLPRGKDSYEERMRKMRAAYDEIDKRAAEVNVTLASIVAERVATEVFFKATGEHARADVRAFVEKQLADQKAVEAELTAQQEQIRKDIAEAMQSIGVDDAQMQQEEQIKKQLADINVAEHELFATARGRIEGSDKGKADQCEAILSRARAAEDSIAGFNARIDRLIDEKLANIKVTVAEEKAHLAEYKIRLGGYAGDTGEVGGAVTNRSFASVDDRFYQIVVRADVGIIDVSWALKQNKTDENSRLVREKKRDLKLLDDEFKEVLKE